MKKIGFIDYYLSEWHADNYVGWIKETAAEMGLDYTVAYAWAELDISPKDGVSTDEWCQKFGVTRAKSIEELCTLCDVILILSPSNPEKHLGYAKAAFPFGKRTYVDKTFAPDLVTAEAIFAEAEKYNVPFFSTSALRYATELDLIAEPQNMSVTGGGIDLAEYIIHQAEQVVKKLGTDIASVTARAHGTQTVFDVRFESGKAAIMTHGKKYSFSVYMSDADGNEAYNKISSPFFNLLIADILRFYETGKPSFDGNETKAAIKLAEMCISSAGK